MVWTAAPPSVVVVTRARAAIAALLGCPVDRGPSIVQSRGRWACAPAAMRWIGQVQVGPRWFTVGSRERITKLAAAGFDVIDCRRRDLRAVDFLLVARR